MSHHEQMGGKSGTKAGSMGTTKQAGKTAAKPAPAKTTTTKKAK